MKIQGKVWGHTVPLFFDNNVEVHAIKVKRGGYCSKHYHKTRYNKFYVQKGCLKITVWKEQADGKTIVDETILANNMECEVAPGDYHMFEAISETEALEIYYVKLDPQDIVRANHGGCEDNE